jgi:hypothetical protein
MGQETRNDELGERQRQNNEGFGRQADGFFDA